MSRIIRDKGPTKRRVDPNIIAKALGAEDTTVEIDVRRGLVSLFSLRQFLVNRLRSADSKCKLEVTGEKCNEILFSNEDWEKLEKIAKYYREKEGIDVSCNQIVSALIQAVEFPDDKEKAEHPISLMDYFGGKDERVNTFSDSKCREADTPESSDVTTSTPVIVNR